MRRYVRAPMASVIRHPEDDMYGESEIQHTTTVIEPEPRMVNTGLLFPDGSPIMAYEATGPIGFVHFEE